MAVTSAEAILVGVILLGGVEAVTAGEAVTDGMVAGIAAVSTAAGGMEVGRTGTDTPIGGGIILTVTKTNSQ